MKTDITPERLRERLRYDPDTGVFTWHKGVTCRAGVGRIGAAAGGPNEQGYVLIRVDRVIYRAHRLAWLYVYGEWPPEDIDHVNGIRSDNRIANLRAVSRRANTENRIVPQPSNLAGLLGVTTKRRAHSITFQAKIVVNKKRRYLGTFDSPEAAHRAYLAAKAIEHEGYAR